MDNLKSHLKAVRTGIASVLQSHGSDALRLDPDFLATATDIINVLGSAPRSLLSVDGLQRPDQLEAKTNATKSTLVPLESKSTVPGRELLDGADRGTTPVPQALGHWEDAPGGPWAFPPEVVDFSTAPNADVKVYFHCLWGTSFIEEDWYGKSPGTRLKKTRQIPDVRVQVMPADRSGRLSVRLPTDEELFSKISAVVKTLTEDSKTFTGIGNPHRPYVRFSGPPRYFLSFRSLLSAVAKESFGQDQGINQLSPTLKESLLNRCRGIVLRSENSALLRSILVPPTQYRVGWQQWSPPLIWCIDNYDFAVEVKDRASALHYLEGLSPYGKSGILDVSIPVTDDNSVSRAFSCYTYLICLSDYDEF